MLPCAEAVQLEAIVRISESLAKLELKQLAVQSHVDEAIRLFNVSTIKSISSGQVHALCVHAHELLIRCIPATQQMFRLWRRRYENCL